jgi:hypothetical protein
MRDKFVFEWKVESDSVYAGAADAGRGFLRFLRLAEGENGLLPLWWSPAKSAGCEALGMKAGWSSLARPITKVEVLEHYDNPAMAMHMRMFVVQVYSCELEGQDGSGALETGLKVENGELIGMLFNIVLLQPFS